MLKVSQKYSPLESAVCALFLLFPSSVIHIRQAAAPRGHTGRIISSVCLPLPHTPSSDLNRAPRICLQKECDLLTIESSSNLFKFEAISPHYPLGFSSASLPSMERFAMPGMQSFGYHSPHCSAQSKNMYQKLGFSQELFSSMELPKHFLRVFKAEMVEKDKFVKNMHCIMEKQKARLKQ